MSDLGIPETPREDAAVVAAWQREFRAACMAAASDPSSGEHITTMRLLLAAPADAALRAQERLRAGRIPTLTLISPSSEE